MLRKSSLFLISLLALATGLRAQQNSLLWEIRGKGLTKPSYLFGTIHMICPQDFFMTDAIKAKFDQSAVLYMEINMDDLSAPATLMDKIQFKGGKKLSDLFDSSNYKDLTQFVKDTLQSDIRFFEKFKPLMLYSIMSVKMLPCGKEEAYEYEFMQMAKKKGKPIKGLETVQDQVSVFDSIPEKEQADMIMDMVRHFDSQKNDFQRLVNFYKAQQLDSLYQMIQESPDTKINEDLLLYNRNRKWVPLIAAAIQRNSCFIAVGAGHLGGPQGLIALLRKKGYTVKPVL